MRGPEKELWLQLCEQIAEEQDPVRFCELTKHLLAELEAKEKRLNMTKKSERSRPAQSE